MGRKRRISSMTAITGLLALSVLGTWLLSMVCLTVVTSQEMYDILYQRSRDYAAAVSQYRLLPEFYDPSYSRYGYQYERPDFLENQLFSAMDRSTSETYQTGGDYRREGRSKWNRDIHYPLEIAAVRVVGFQEGTEWTPVTMHYVTDEMVRQVVESNVQFSTGPSSYAYFLSDVDRTGQLEWQLSFDYSSEYAGKALSTIYITHPDLRKYPGRPLTYKGTEYQNLADLTASVMLPLPGSRIRQHLVQPLTDVQNTREDGWP